ncbi:hypothetical protein L6164_008356 [Bauhinia variegata]|uniref:Uncharacterized protein n=1 Tax=Bauhinia variegata TaxID=167791 RepID=A0ACB9PJA9_BAUVA|nr:hypothetical protein L6164_008356 [Bauhinia variegata]
MAEVSNEETHPEPSPKPEQTAPEGSNPKKKRKKKKPVCYFGEAQLNQLDSGNHHEPVPEPEPKPSQDPEHSQPQLFSNSESNPESVAAPLKGSEHHLEHPEIDLEPPQDPGQQQPQLFQKSESNPEQVELLDKPMPAPLISPGLKKSRRKRNKSVGNLEEAAAESNGLNAVQPELKPTPLKEPECPRVFPKPESNSEHQELPNKSEPATPTESRQKKRKRKKLKSEQPVLKPTPLSDPLHFPIPEPIPPKDPAKPEPKLPQDREQSQPQLFSNSGSNPESVPAPPKGLEYLPGHPELEPENPQGRGLKKRKRKRKKSVGNLDEAAAVSNGLNAVQPSRGPESNSENRELPNKTDLATAIDSNPESNPESVPAYPKCLEHCPEHPKLEPEPPQDPGHPQPQLFPKLELNPEHIELPYKQMAAPIISPGLKKRKRKKKKSVGNFEEAAAESNRLNAVQPELNPTPSKGPECPELFPKPESNSEHHELPDKPNVAIPTDSNPEPVPAPPKGLEHLPEHPKLEPEPQQDPGHLQHQLFPKSESNPGHVELPSKPMPAPLISPGVKKRKRKKKKSVGNLEKAAAESKGLDAVQPELKPTPLKDPECPQLCPKPESNSEHHVLPNKPDPATPTDSRQKKRKRKRKRKVYLEEADSNKLKSEQPQLKPTPLLDPKQFSIPEPTSQNDPGPEPVTRPEATPQEDPEQKKKKKKRKKKKKGAPELENTEPNGVNVTESRGLKVTRKRLKRASERNRLPEQSVMGETPATAYWFGDGVNATYFVPVNGMYFVPSNVVFPGMWSSQQCFACRQYGHKASNCQLVKRLRPDQEICFFCGEIGHSLGKCPQSIKGESQYAQCLACKNYGHLSRNCPQNVKGIDPPGGQPVAASGPIDTSKENDMTLSEGPMTRGKVKRIQEAFGGHVDELLVQENKVQVEDARRAEVLLIQAQGNQGPA